MLLDKLETRRDGEGTMKIICVWCKRVIRKGKGEGPVRHGICSKCERGLEAAARQEVEKR